MVLASEQGSMAPRKPLHRRIIGRLFPPLNLWRTHRSITPSHHGLRRRKNCTLLVAGTVTRLFVPSLLTLAVFETQVVGEVSVSVCSSAKSAVSDEGQETVISLPEGWTESVGGGRR